MVVWHSLVERDTINSYLAVYANTLESYMKYTLQQHKFVQVFTYIHTKGPSASYLALQAISDILHVVWLYFVLTSVYDNLGVPYNIHVRTTQIHPGFYIYTHESSFCLIVSIIISIQYVSRCVIQIFKSVRFILHALLLDYISSSVHVKNLPPTAL